MSIFKKILLFFLFFSFSWNIFAHPIDISKSIIWIKENKMNVTTYFHSFEIDYLLKTNDVKVESVADYFLHPNIIEDYIKKTVFLENDNKICQLEEFTFYEDEIYEVLTEWLKVTYKISCSKDISNFKLSINYFNNFPLQTNRVKMYDLNDWVKSILYKVLTPKISDIEVENLSTFEPRKVIDSDCDWMWNEDEKIYKTNPYKVDTDWDNYTDFQEITWWWNPLDKELWPGQYLKEELDKVQCKKEQLEINNDPQVQKDNKEDYSSLDSNGYWNDFLKDILKYINSYITKNEWSIIYIFLLIYILWIIHAAWPWHSKSLLVAYTLQKDTWYKKGLLYSVIFSVTHILDILLLFFITTLIFNYVDVSKYSYYIQVVSIIILFIFSIYLVYKAFKKNKKKKAKEKTAKKTLLIAFLAWLAPCSFAWSIYFLLLSLWKLSLILPLIAALWLWIATMLAIIVVITVFLKEKTLNKTKIFSEYSTKISAIIILMIAIFLLIKILSN